MKLDNNVKNKDKCMNNFKILALIIFRFYKYS